MKLIEMSTTFKNKAEAKKAAELILKNKLAACVQILGPAESKYWWEGRIETTEEYLVFIKTTNENFGKVEELIQENNSYELPEIIAKEIVAGTKDYLDWFKKIRNKEKDLWQKYN
jgi:periplasmic divalent cation tolerance protein